VNVDNLDEFCGKALALYEDAPQQVRCVTKYRYSDKLLFFKITNGITVGVP